MNRLVQVTLPDGRLFVGSRRSILGENQRLFVGIHQTRPRPKLLCHCQAGRELYVAVAFSHFHGRCILRALPNGRNSHAKDCGAVGRWPSAPRANKSGANEISPYEEAFDQVYLRQVAGGVRDFPSELANTLNTLLRRPARGEALRGIIRVARFENSATHAPHQADGGFELEVQECGEKVRWTVPAGTPLHGRLDAFSSPITGSFILAGRFPADRTVSELHVWPVYLSRSGSTHAVHSDFERRVARWLDDADLEFVKPPSQRFLGSLAVQSPQFAWIKELVAEKVWPDFLCSVRGTNLAIEAVDSAEPIYRLRLYLKRVRYQRIHQSNQGLNWVFLRAEGESQFCVFDSSAHRAVVAPQTRVVHFGSSTG